MYKILEKILRFGLFAAPFTALLIVPGFLYAFIFPRTLLMQILIGVLGAIWLILALRRGIKFGGTAIVYLVAGFWAVNLLATIFSVSPR